MKKLHPLLSVLFLIYWGCETPIDIETLQKRGDGYYEINSEEPFSGQIIGKYSSGEKEITGYLKDGKKDGLWTRWTPSSGGKYYETNYKDGKKDGLETNWFYDGNKHSEGNFKNNYMNGKWTF
tara:strand:+ start:116 stop:484 length:369 start_codon:yes stop_codon:yes gene_type:complete